MIDHARSRAHHDSRSRFILGLTLLLALTGFARQTHASNSGANELEVPLELPAGPKGLVPDLSLSYSSRRGLGALGFGWDVRQSSVRLESSNRIDPWSSPEWLLDGMLLVETGTPGKLVPEVVDQSVVEHHLDPLLGDSFKVYRSDGWVAEYGGSSDSKVLACGLPAGCRTLEARLNKLIDPFGLAIEFDYTDLGEPGAIYLDEVRWVIGIANDTPIGPLRTARFHYGSLGPVWRSYEAGVERALGSQLSEIEVLVDGNHLRSWHFEYDLTSNGGWVLRRIDEEGRRMGGAGPLRPVISELSWSDDGVHWDHWAWGPETWLDCTGGAASIVHAADTGGVYGDWFDLLGDQRPDCVFVGDDGFGNPTLEVVVDDTSGAGNPTSLGTLRSLNLEESDYLRELDAAGVVAEFIDLNGDSYTDRVWWDGTPGELQVQFRDTTTGQNFAFEPATTLPLLNPGGLPSTVDARLSGEVVAGLTRSTDRGLLDLNGDRLPDYVVAGSIVWSVWLNEGGSFGEAQLWSAPGPDLGYAETTPGTNEIDTTDRTLVDLNGDGLLDYIDSNPSPARDCGPSGSETCAWEVSYGTGSGFATPVPFELGVQGRLDAHVPIGRVSFAGPCGIVNPPPCGTPNPPDSGIHLTDLNGDRLPDLVRELVVSLAHVDTEVLFNQSGDRFGPAHTAELPMYALGPMAWSVGGIDLGGGGDMVGRYVDLNADGFLDWLVDDGFGNAGYLQAVDAGGKPVLPPNLLVGVRGPFGGETTYDYAPAPLSSSIPWESEAALPQWNLSGVRHSSPDVPEATLSWEDPRTVDRSFLGYGGLRIDFPATLEYVVYDFHNGIGSDELLAGRVAEATRYNEFDEKLSSRVQTWQVIPRTDDAIVALQSVTTSRWGVPDPQTSTQDESTHTVLYEVDPVTGYLDATVDLAPPTDLQPAGVGATVRTEFHWSTTPHPHAAGTGFAVEQLLAEGRTRRSDPTGANTLESELDLVWTGSPPVLQESKRMIEQTPVAWSTTHFGYDSIGVRTSMTDPVGAVTTYTWNGDYTEVERAITTSGSYPPQAPPHNGPGPVTHRVVRTVEPYEDRLHKVEYFNGPDLVDADHFTYDAFGRLTEVWTAAPSVSVPVTTSYKSRELSYGSYYPGPAAARFVEETSYAAQPAVLPGANPSQVISRTERTYLDDFGRVAQHREEVGIGGEALVTWLQRGDDGRIERAALPVVEAGLGWTPPNWTGVYTEVSRRAGGRGAEIERVNVSVGEPDAYRLTQWTVLDGELARERVTNHESGGVVTPRSAWEYRDGRGRTIRLQDPDGNLTEYLWDPLGRVSEIEDAHLNVTTMEYDLLGRRLLLADPDLSQCGPDPTICPWTYEYDDAGRLTSRTDAKGQVVDFDYDELGRLISQEWSCGSASGCTGSDEGDSWFFYDGATSPTSAVEPWEIGSLTYVVDESGSTQFDSDSAGRVWGELRDVDGEHFRIRSDVDSWGLVHRVAVEHMGSGAVFDPVLYSYDDRGNLESVAEENGTFEWLTSVVRDPSTWRLTFATSDGGAIERHLDYFAGGTLKRYSARGVLNGAPAGWSGVLQETELTWDAAGRVKSKEDRLFDVGGQPALEEYEYDDLDRLTGVVGSHAGYGRTYAYDALGNLTSSSLQSDRYGVGTYDYDASIEGGPHAVKAIGTHTSFQYDDNGALVGRQRSGTATDYDRSYGYAADGRLRSTHHADLTGGGNHIDVTNLLDAGKRRVKKEVVTSSSVEEVYTPSPFLELRNGVPTKAVFIMGQRWAETTHASITTGDTITWFFEDHQGQQAASLEARVGATPGSEDYLDFAAARRDPYGVVVDGDEDLFSRTVGGGEADPEGETMLGVRAYDAEVGRFLQADVLSHFGGSQGLNRYRYGWNSPTNYSDPSGFSEVPLTIPYMGGPAGSPMTWSAGHQVQTSWADRSLAVGFHGGGAGSGFVSHGYVGSSFGSGLTSNDDDDGWCRANADLSGCAEKRDKVDLDDPVGDDDDGTTDGDDDDESSGSSGGGKGAGSSKAKRKKTVKPPVPDFGTSWTGVPVEEDLERWIDDVEQVLTSIDRTLEGTGEDLIRGAIKRGVRVWTVDRVTHKGKVLGGITRGPSQKEVLLARSSANAPLSHRNRVLNFIHELLHAKWHTDADGESSHPSAAVNAVAGSPTGQGGYKFGEGKADLKRMLTSDANTETFGNEDYRRAF